MGEYDAEDAEFEKRIRERYPVLGPIAKASDNRTKAAGPRSRETYRRWLTPVEEFYVLNHYPTPVIDAEGWCVSLTGAVDEPVDLSLTDLIDGYPTVTIPHTMECAGNGRSGFEDVDGEPGRYVQWRDSAVGNAMWTGTPLRAVFADHGADTSAGSWLAVIGGDAPGDEDVFARSLPMSKATKDCLLAYEMNGAPLTPEHGYPVRLVVPGWYGVNSVKWVTELRAMDRMMAGPEWRSHSRWQQRGYRHVGRDAEPAERESIDEFDTWRQLRSGEPRAPYLYDQNVMSLISAPEDGARVVPDADGRIEVEGVAWAGDDAVSAAEASADGGETWYQGEFVTARRPNTWRRFHLSLPLPPGHHDLVSRATDEHGRSQPARTGAPDETLASAADVYPWNREGYGNNAYSHYGIEVEVEPRDG